VWSKRSKLPDSQAESLPFPFEKPYAIKRINRRSVFTTFLTLERLTLCVVRWRSQVITTQNPVDGSNPHSGHVSPGTTRLDRPAVVIDRSRALSSQVEREVPASWCARSAGDTRTSSNACRPLLT
jgi:hypothetical protein